MNPIRFVALLKEEVRNGVDDEIKYYANPPVENPPGHVGVFTRWYQGLPDGDKEVARQALQHVAEGSLFRVLNILDNVQSLTTEEGNFELYFVNEHYKTRINETEGDFLYDIFNSIE